MGVHHIAAHPALANIGLMLASELITLFLLKLCKRNHLHRNDETHGFPHGGQILLDRRHGSDSVKIAPVSGFPRPNRYCF